MKLWQKIALLCSGVLVAAVSLCAALLLGQARGQLLDMIQEQGRNRQQNLAASFQNFVGMYASSEDSDTVTKSLLRYGFSRYDNGEGVLVLDGQVLAGNPEVNVLSALPEVGEQPSQTQLEENGRHYLITGSVYQVYVWNNRPCRVYLCQDITPVHDSLSRMGWVFFAIGSLCTILALGAIALLVRRSLAPLGQLEQAAAQIAQGRYDQRAKTSARDEIGSLAGSFNQMADSVQTHIQTLQDTAQRQQLFIGGVTHEFKTPLTGILLSVDTLQNMYLEEEEQQAALSRIAAQGQWLERLVQKLLKLLTLNQELTLAPVSLEALTEAVAESTREVLSARGLTLKTSCTPGTIQGDFDLLRSALVNLVDNAGKASAPGGTVFLRIRPDLLTVEDHGRGIPAEALSRVTDPFFMVDKSRSKAQGGVGLGLALVREIVRAHGGTLEILSQPGQGTTVNMYLPGNETVTAR